MEFGFASEMLSDADKKFYLSLNIKGEYSSKLLSAPKGWIVSENRDVFFAQNEQPDRWNEGCEFYDLIYKNEVCKVAVIREVELRKIIYKVRKIRIEKDLQSDEKVICDAIKDVLGTMAEGLKPEYEIVEWPQAIDYHFIMPREERERIARENDLFRKKTEIEIAKNIEKAKKDYGNSRVTFMPEFKKNKVDIRKLEADMLNEFNDFEDLSLELGKVNSVDTSNVQSEEDNQFGTFAFEMTNLSKSDREFFCRKGILPEDSDEETPATIDYINKIYLIDDAKTQSETIKHMVLIYKDNKNDFYVKIDMQAMTIIYKVIGYELSEATSDKKEMIVSAFKDAIKTRSRELQMNCNIIIN